MLIAEKMVALHFAASLFFGGALSVALGSIIKAAGWMAAAAGALLFVAVWLISAVPPG